jgi:hypothetical protein
MGVRTTRVLHDSAFSELSTIHLLVPEQVPIARGAYPLSVRPVNVAVLKKRKSPASAVRDVGAHHSGQMSRCELCLELPHGPSTINIFSRHATNESLILLAQPGAAAAWPRSPPPVQAKARTMPSDHRLRLHDDQNIRPTKPHVRQSGPEEGSTRFSEGRGRFRLSTATCCRRARTSREVSRRLQKKTRMAARNAVIKWSTNQPL